MNRVLYTHFYIHKNSEISEFFEARRIFQEVQKNEEITAIDTIEEVKDNLSILKNGLQIEPTQANVRVLKAQVEGIKGKKEFSISREKLKEKMRTEAVKDIIEKNIKTFSAGQLLMAEEIFPGMLKSMFINDGTIDFQGNREAESLIGLGDIFPISQTYIVIYDERTGEWEAGVRGLKKTSMGMRPAYLNIGASESTKKSKKTPSKPGDYIEILDNYKVVKISGKSGIEAFKKDIKTSDIRNIISKDEAIFDEKVKNKNTGKLENTKADIQKNDDAKKDWVEEISTAKKEKTHYYSENFNPEEFSSQEDLIEVARSQKIPENSIKTFLYAMGKETGKTYSLLSNSRFIRTKVRPKKGKKASSAFGPVQITVSLAKDYAKKKGLFNPQEQEFLNRLIAQGQKMLEADSNDPIYGFGGTGEPYFRKKENKILYFQVAMKMFHDHINRAGTPEKGLKWWRWGEYGYQKHQGEDSQYFQGLQNALQKDLPKTQKKETFKRTEAEKQLFPKRDTAPYINPRKNPNSVLSIKRTTENKILASGYPETIFLANLNGQPKYSAKEIQEISDIINNIYKQKGKNMPIIYIDNEHGAVQRISSYPDFEKNSKNYLLQISVQKRLNTVKNSSGKSIAGDVQQGKPSLQTLEEAIDQSSDELKKSLMTDYAQLRIAQEKSLGLNSISLVLDEGGSDVIKRRGFTKSALREQYANILIEEAEKQNMQVLIKHFPGHAGFKDPHKYGPGTRETMHPEMKTFIKILQENSNKKNITVMLGHINITALGWESYDNNIDKNIVVASQSKTVADKLRAINPNIRLISDDIAGMKASGDIQKARKNAKEAEITVLN